MADEKITELAENTAPTLDDLLALVNSPVGTPATQKLSIGNLWSILNAPSAFLVNGKIVPSVTSANITVAIKGMDGNDPSATNPVLIRINGVIRKITSALSVTKNAGTNWFNSGSAELATMEIDYFVYLGYNATDGVVIGFARIPYVTEYSQFSATTTDEKFCAISTITNAAASDSYENIGRFLAVLGVSASYNWSVSTFTNTNLIQRPIYVTRWLSYTPAWTGSGSLTFNPATQNTGKYQIDYRTVRGYVVGKGTTGGTTSSNLIATLPLSVSGTIATYDMWGSGYIYDGATIGGTAVINLATIAITRYDFANIAVAASKEAKATFWYMI